VSAISVEVVTPGKSLRG